MNTVSPLQEKLMYLLLIVLFILNIGVLAILTYQTNEGSKTRQVLLANQKELLRNDDFITCSLKAVVTDQLITQTELNACIASKDN